MQLEALLRAYIARSRLSPVTFGQFVQRLSTTSYGLVCTTLNLPSLLPFSIWPLSTIGGGCFVALGWYMARGRTAVVLPPRLQRFVVPAAVWQRVLHMWQRVYGLTNDMSMLHSKTMLGTNRDVFVPISCSSLRDQRYSS